MGTRALSQLIAGAASAQSRSGLAHHGEAADLLWPIVLATLLAASAGLYAAGVTKLWCKAGPGRGIRRVEVAHFTAGWLLLAATLAPPVDILAERSFALHMVQHELLMVVAAPLLVLSRPLQAFAWALPAAARSAVAFVPRGAWRVLNVPAGAWSVHALALWLWHIPVLFLAALADPSLHVLQHTCFFVSAFAFWWAVFGRRAPDATGVACLFTTMLHTSALAVLLTFAPAPWYAHDATIPFGLTALEDQQLGGLLMWVPGAFAYVVAGLAIVADWLRQPRAQRGVR
jgi:cytochrome c oxidase assembly factor CtaG